jgi:hypothetical protein
VVDKPEQVSVGNLANVKEAMSQEGVDFERMAKMEAVSPAQICFSPGLEDLVLGLGRQISTSAAFPSSKGLDWQHRAPRHCRCWKVPDASQQTLPHNDAGTHYTKLKPLSPSICQMLKQKIVESKSSTLNPKPHKMADDETERGSARPVIRGEGGNNSKARRAVEDNGGEVEKSEGLQQGCHLPTRTPYIRGVYDFRSVVHLSRCDVTLDNKYCANFGGRRAIAFVLCLRCAGQLGKTEDWWHRDIDFLALSCS